MISVLPANRLKKQRPVANRLPARRALPSLWVRALCLALICLGMCCPAMADEKTAESGKSPADGVIETKADKPSDAQIRKRAKGIFAEISGLEKVTVAVNEGVVRLSGSVANEEHAQHALRLANRLAGVVVVEDDIERTLDLRENLTPLMDEYSGMLSGLVKALPLVLAALVIFGLLVFAGFKLAGFSRFWRKITPNRFLADIFSQIVRVVFVLAAFIMAMNLLGAKQVIGTLLGGAGVIGIAVGFAVKDTIENYIASIMLSLRQPFRAQDHVRINDYEGYVIRLTSRATVLMTLDGNHLRIPNAEVFKAVILNFTTNPERRFDFALGVDAGDDPVKATEVGLAAISRLDFILASPPPNALIETVGDSNIVIRFTGWVNQTRTDFFKARGYAIQAAKAALEDQDFSLPEPIYRLRFDNSPAMREPATARGPAAPVQAPSKPSEGKISPPMDVTPENHIQEKVEDERKALKEGDLLDADSPNE